MKRFDDVETLQRTFVEGDERVRHDVIVVGSGACGGVAAYELARRGLDVLVVDAGDLPDPEADFSTAAWDGPRREAQRARQPVQSRHPSWNGLNPRLFVDDLELPYSTPEHAPFVWIRQRLLGGRTTTWGAVTLRMSDLEFKAGSQDGRGLDWPIGHDDLAPYYERLERMMRVRGARDGLRTVPDGAFGEPAPMTEGEKQLRERVAARWPGRVFVSTRGIEDSLEGREAAGTSFPLMSSLATTLLAAARTGRLRIRPGAIVERVLVDDAKRSAVGVEVVDAKTRRTQVLHARAVVLCASTLETTRILLNSRGPRDLDGLGNASGVLGRYLMEHPSRVCWGSAKGMRGPNVRFGGPHSIYLPRFRNLDRLEAPFLRGYGLWAAVERQIVSTGTDEPQFMLAACMEMIPRLKNHVALNRAKLDAWGLPTLDIECTRSENEDRMDADAAETIAQIVELAGFEAKLAERWPPGLFVHEVGTARMGAEPGTSYLDPWNRSWEIPNLLVTDGACWVSSGYQNPTLTMMAISWRACDRLAGELLAATG